ncbi:hypothetical protein FQA39_LY01659 [Lamprigera yunnana]|nr:hypothetical protein FQA39_LY01659 [Lamprigera yunnana]
MRPSPSSKITNNKLEVVWDIYEVTSKGERLYLLETVASKKKLILGLPNDMENYMKYHLMRSVSQVRMKLGSIPTKFACQPGRKTGTSVERQYIRKKQKMMAIEECEKQLEESNGVTEHFDFEDIAFGSSGTYFSRFM